MMKARLTNGQTVTLARECGCLPTIHPMDVPHWLHADQIWRDRNTDLQDKAEAILSKPHLQESQISQGARLLRAHCHEQIARLREKRFNMQRLHIAEILYETTPDEAPE